MTWKIALMVVCLLLGTQTIQPQETLSNESVLKMVKAGLSEDTIVNAIAQHAGNYSLTVDDLIRLKTEGIPDKILHAMQAKMAKPAVAAPAVMAAPVASSSGGSVLIADGTPIKLRLMKALSSADAAVGDTVEFEVLQELRINDFVAISRGAKATGIITEAHPSKRGNIPGKIEIDMQEVVLTNGVKAKLRDSEQPRSITRIATKTSTRVLGTAGSLGMKHGSEKTLGVGTGFGAFIDENVTIDRPMNAPSAVAPVPASAPGPAAPPVSAPSRSSVRLTTSPTDARAERPRPDLDYILQSDPPRVAIVDHSARKLLTSIPLDTKVHGVLLDSDAKHLYITHGKRSDTKLLVFDIEKMGPLREILLGHPAEGMVFTKDESRILIYSRGIPGQKPTPVNEARVSIIDTVSNTRSFVHRLGSPAVEINYLAVADRVMVLSSGLLPQSTGKVIGAGFTLGLNGGLVPFRDTAQKVWFIDPHANPRATQAVELGGKMWGSAVSADGKRLLALVEAMDKKGKKVTHEGSVMTFDLESGMAVQAGDPARKASQLAQLGNSADYWLHFSDRIQRVSPQGELESKSIYFANQAKNGAKGLGGIPGSSLEIGERRYAINLFAPFNWLTDNSTTLKLAHKVAIVDAASGKVESVTPIGRPGVRTQKAVNRFMLAMALSAAAGAAGGAVLAYAPPGTTIMVPVFYPGPGSRQIEMTCNEDQSTLYVLDVESDDVTAIRTADGSVIGILPMKSKGAGLWRPKGSDYLYHIAPATVTVIDTRSNKVVQEIEKTKDVRFWSNGTRGEFSLVWPDRIEIWDARKAERRGGVEGIDSAARLIRTLNWSPGDVEEFETDAK